MKNIKLQFIESLNFIPCKRGQTRFLAHEGGIEDYFDNHPYGAADFFWCIKNGLLGGPFAHIATPERLDACAEKAPWAALEYAADRLTPERLDWCAAKEPWLALEYAADRLTPERLDWCKKQV